jgi:hypothetical protein
MQSPSTSHRESSLKIGRNKSGSNSSFQKKRKGSSKAQSEDHHHHSPQSVEDYGRHRVSDKLKLSWTKTESLDFGVLCGHTVTWEETIYFRNGGSDEILEYNHR